MIRNLKALGLALMALCALGAVMASGASAQQGVLTGGPVTLTGAEVGVAGDNELRAFGGFVRCPGSEYTGHQYTEYEETTHEETTEEVEHNLLIPDGATTATLTPHYKEVNAEKAPNCTGPLGISATVDMNGCDYVVHLGEPTGTQPEVGGTYGVTFDVICPPNETITVTLWKSESEHTEKPTTPFCDFHVKEQKGLKGAHATDEGNGHIKLSGTVEGIHVHKTATHPTIFTCPESPTTETEGKFDLNVTVSGHDSEAKETPISISDE